MAKMLEPLEKVFTPEESEDMKMNGEVSNDSDDIKDVKEEKWEATTQPLKDIQNLEFAIKLPGKLNKVKQYHDRISRAVSSIPYVEDHVSAPKKSSGLPPVVQKSLDDWDQDLTDAKIILHDMKSYIDSRSWSNKSEALDIYKAASRMIKGTTNGYHKQWKDVLDKYKD